MAANNQETLYYLHIDPMVGVDLNHQFKSIDTVIYASYCEDDIDALLDLLNIKLKNTDFYKTLVCSTIYSIVKNKTDNLMIGAYAYEGPLDELMCHGYANLTDHNSGDNRTHIDNEVYKILENEGFVQANSEIEL